VPAPQVRCAQKKLATACRARQGRCSPPDGSLDDIGLSLIVGADPPHLREHGDVAPPGADALADHLQPAAEQKDGDDRCLVRRERPDAVVAVYVAADSTRVQAGGVLGRTSPAP
jgi:hypothetical protein